MNKRLLSVLGVLGLVAGCSNPTGPAAQAPSQDSSLAAVQHDRACDLALAWQYKHPGADVPEKYRDLMGLWTGEVQFLSGSSMCIAVAVSEVTATGEVNSLFAWNLGASPSNGESLNLHSEGKAGWWAKGINTGPKGEEMVVFSATEPYQGLMYEYRFSFPKDGKMVGALIGKKLDGSTASSDVALLTRSSPTPELLAAAGK